MDPLHRQISRVCKKNYHALHCKQFALSCTVANTAEIWCLIRLWDVSLPVLFDVWVFDLSQSVSVCLTCPNITALVDGAWNTKLLNPPPPFIVSKSCQGIAQFGVRLKSQAQYWRRFEAPVRQGIFLPGSTSSAVSVQPPCVIACTNICAHVKNPKHTAI